MLADFDAFAQQCDKLAGQAAAFAYLIPSVI
jgi:hypothetical protein